jgi:hypothetical protein
VESEGALRLSSFPPSGRRNGGRKVFENRDRIREKPRREAAILKERDANFCLRSESKKLRKIGKHSQSLREDEVSRRRSPHGGKRSRRARPLFSPNPRRWK